MKYLVAVDGGASSDAALRTVCAVMKGDDTLLIVTIVVDVQRQFYSSLAPHVPPFPSFSDAQRAVNGDGRRLVERSTRLARSLGVGHVVALLGISTHEGEFLCRLAKSRAVDFIYLGRRGLNAFSRFFMGSTSKYVMEHAPCSVCVIKKLPATAAPTHTQASTALPVTTAPVSVAAMGGAKPSDAMAHSQGEQWGASKAEEELERRRQVEEEKSILEEEGKEREAAHIGAVIAEEEERKRRIAEERVVEDRKFHVQIYDVSEHN